MTSHNPHLRIHPEVVDALATGRPVVALETAAVTHGLPREPARMLPRLFESPGFPREVREAFVGRAANAALGRALAAAVRAEGAVPATVGFLRGQLVIGLTDDEVDALADMREVRKISARDAGPAHAAGASGGTTVAGTILACGLAQPRAIEVFATGGIGGVHRGFAERPDISADLLAIRDGGTLVITAGAKSILDLPATVELLDTLGVPTAGLGTTAFPRFLSPGDASLRVENDAGDAAGAARIFRAQRLFTPSRGMLLCVPPPDSDAIPAETMERAIAEGLARCERESVRGPDVTPVLLATVAEATEGRSLATNLAVLVENARVGARVARALATRAT